MRLVGLVYSGSGAVPEVEVDPGGGREPGVPGYVPRAGLVAAGAFEDEGQLPFGLVVERGVRAAAGRGRGPLGK